MPGLSAGRLRRSLRDVRNPPPVHRRSSGGRAIRGDEPRHPTTIPANTTSRTAAIGRCWLGSRRSPQRVLHRRQGSFSHSPSGGIIFDSCRPPPPVPFAAARPSAFPHRRGSGGGGLPLRRPTYSSAQFGVVEQQPAPVGQAFLQQLCADRRDRLGDVRDRQVVIQVRSPVPLPTTRAHSALRSGTWMRSSNFCRRTSRWSIDASDASIFR